MSRVATCGLAALLISGVAPFGCAGPPGGGASSAASAPVKSPSGLSSADETAVFEAAGFRHEQSQWRLCDDANALEEPTYYPGEISRVRDLDGDGRPEAIVTEQGVGCYGLVGTFFVLVSQQHDRSWQAVYASPGIPEFLSTKGEGGWPDLLIGGPGLCFPVLRWNGNAYALDRHEYQGQPCQPR